MSSLPCLFKLILKYSLHRTINYFALCAIILSICSLFTVNAVLRGFDSELQSLFRGSLADTMLEWDWNPPQLKELDKKLTPLTVWAPALEGFGMIKTERYVSAISFKGIDPSKEKSLRKSMNISTIDFSSLSKKQLKKESPLGGMLGLFGTVSQHKISSPIMVGEVLAKDLSLAIGDRIKLLVPNWQDQIKEIDFYVASIFKSGIYEDDQGKVFISLNNAQDLLSKPDSYSYIQCSSTKNVEQIKKVFPRVKVSSWKDKHKMRLRAVDHERKLIAVVLSLIVLVSSFGILAIQWSFVLEKTSDIGILQAIGFSKFDIFFIFLGVTWVIGILGLATGLGLGVILCENVNQLINFLNINIFPTELYYHDGLPVKIQESDFIWISCLSLFVTTFAGFIPAWKALTVEPITAITYE